MYCKNCGNVMDDNAAICVKCGCAAGTGTSYCPNCGKATVPGAAACTNCGVGLNAAVNDNAKSKLVAGLLGIFLGSLGVHNFYLGFTGKAIAQLLITVITCGAGSIVSGIWSLIEAIMILTGNEKYRVDAKGVPLKD